MSTLEKFGALGIALSVCLNLLGLYFFVQWSRLVYMLGHWPARALSLFLKLRPGKIGRCVVYVFDDGEVEIHQNKEVVSDSTVDPSEDP